MFQGLLEPLLKTWPSTIVDEFRAHRGDRDKSRVTDPYWLTLPRTICQARNLGRSAISGQTVELLLRGQLCLFFGIRLLDDLLDGHARSPRLAVASDLFLLEGERIFESVPDLPSAFSALCKEAVRDTLMGIVRVDELQRDPHSEVEALLEGYAKVDSVLSVGTVAALEVMGRQEDIPRIHVFSRELGKASQILDDLYDMEEDLASGKVNVPVRIAFDGSLPAKKPIDESADLPKDLLDDSWRAKVGEVVKPCLLRAREALSGLRISLDEDYVEDYGTAIETALATCGQDGQESVGMWDR